MIVRLAIQNMRQGAVRTAVGLVGVAFAVVLMFMQLGFLGSVSRTATLIYDELEFDLLLRSKNYLHLGLADSIPKARLRQALRDPDVASATGLLIGAGLWREPLSPNERRAPRYGTLVLLGVDTEAVTFSDAETQSGVTSLRKPLGVLIDRESSTDFGPVDVEQGFGEDDVGVRTEINGRTVEIVGHFAMGAGFGGDGAAVASAETFRSLTPIIGADDVSLGLVNLKADADPTSVARRLSRVLAEAGARDAVVLTREQVAEFEQTRWVDETPVGTIFTVAVYFACFVAIVIVYQVLSADVSSRMAEFATMKAIGYSNMALSSVVLLQAALLAMGGFAVGCPLALGLYSITVSQTGLPIAMTPLRVGGVFLMTSSVCLGSAFWAVRKLRTASPADLF